MKAIYDLINRAWSLAWQDQRTPARGWIRRALDRLGVPLDTPPRRGDLGAVASLLRLYQCAPAGDREYRQALEDLRLALLPGAMGVWAGPCPREDCDRTGTHRHIEDSIVTESSLIDGRDAVVVDEVLARSAVGGADEYRAQCRDAAERKRG